MEKLVYVLWKQSDVCVEDFRDDLIGASGARLARLGAKQLALSVADEHVAYAQGSLITHMQAPIIAVVSFWLDSHLERAPLEEVIGNLSSRHAGYLVLESVPIVNTVHTAPPGTRTPGIHTIAFLEKPDRLTYEEWLELWQGRHTAVGVETQSTFLYIQNVVVRAVSEAAPPWVAIVEEGFPREALTDQKIFYAAGDSQAKLEENRGRMIESCKRFIDFDQLESHMFSQYVLGD